MKMKIALSAALLVAGSLLVSCAPPESTPVGVDSTKVNIDPAIVDSQVKEEAELIFARSEKYLLQRLTASPSPGTKSSDIKDQRERQYQDLGVYLKNEYKAARGFEWAYEKNDKNTGYVIKVWNPSSSKYKTEDTAAVFNSLDGKIKD